MHQLIPIISKLHQVFSTIGYDPLDLPQIVVVGSQSSGKTSVLESIVGKDFLPRGSDIVTRRPLVLQLVHEPKKETNESQEVKYSDAVENEIETEENEALAETETDISHSQDWAEFLHLPGRHFYDFNQVRQEIERETARIAGVNKGVSRAPIHLRIHSPNVLDLTLVDLPGITKIPVGDQPDDIEQQIRALIHEYASRRNTIILAVTPANIDLVNSEALKYAREVDPEGYRTLGVLTKLDLMDAGTHALDVLLNRGSIRLRLGFIGVVNRSQKDIVEQRGMADALASEREFFRHHLHYRHVAHRCGSAYLSKTLNTLLMQHIKEKLPELRSKLNSLILSTQQELTSYGEAVIMEGSAPHRGSLLLTLLTKFATDFSDAIEGRSKHISTYELCGGARINYIFCDIYSHALSQVDPCGGLSLNDIRTVIRNSTGPRPSLFVPEVSFDLLVKKQISKLEAPGMRCMELVYDELLKVVSHCERQELIRYPHLHQRVMDVASELIRERLAPTTLMIENLIQIELAYINTNHPDFMGAGAAISALGKIHERRKRETATEKRQKLREKEREEVESPVVVATVATPSLVPPSRPRSPLTTLVPPPTAVTAPTATAKKPSALSVMAPPLSAHSASSTATAASQRDSGLLNYFFGSTDAAGIDPITGIASSKQTIYKRPTSPLRTAAVTNTTRDSEDVLLDLQFSQMNLLQESEDREPREPGFLSEKEEIETHLIRSLIQSYYNVVRKNLQDIVPKAIMHFLVNYSKEHLQNRLVRELYREELLESLLREDETISRERSKCTKMLQVLRQAQTIVSEIRETAMKTA